MTKTGKKKQKQKRNNDETGIDDDEEDGDNEIYNSYNEYNYPPEDYCMIENWVGPANMNKTLPLTCLNKHELKQRLMLLRKKGFANTPYKIACSHFYRDYSFKVPLTTTRNMFENVSDENKYHYFSLLNCKLDTGRTHQIRLHLSKCLGLSVVGDRIYSRQDDIKFKSKMKYKKIMDYDWKIEDKLFGFDSDFDNQYRINWLNHDFHALHAKSLSFQHPTSLKQMKFEASLPPMFTKLVKTLSPYRVS